MKLWTKITTLLAGVGLLAIGLTAQAATVPIANSKHNMNLVFGAGTVEDGQICLPCHNPHNQPQKMDAIWNHEMPTQTYNLWDNTNDQLDETSLMCLSCHDGSVAVDSYGTSLSGGGLSSPTTPHKLGTSTDINGASTAGFQIGAGGDLTHEHPIGMVYPGLTANAVKTSWDITKAGSFNDPNKWVSGGFTTNKAPGNSTAGTGSAQTYASGLKQVGGSMSLAAGPGETNATRVGCGTCHTPHTNTYHFLHIPNTNSQLCLTCHDK